jgi:Bacterial Ig-like domain (group 1)
MVTKGQGGTAERRCDLFLLKTRVFRAMQVKTAYAVEQLIWRTSGTLWQRVQRRKEKDMTKQRRYTSEWMVGLALALVVLLGAQGFGQTPKYHLALEAPMDATQNEALNLVAIVRDSQGQPVNAVPVEFSVPSDWQNNITFTPQRPVTQNNGQASTMFQSNMTGEVRVTARVGDSTMMAIIAVSGAGSYGPGRSR